MHSLLCVVSFERQPSMNSLHPDIHISGNYRKKKKQTKTKSRKGTFQTDCLTSKIVLVNQMVIRT